MLDNPSATGFRSVFVKALLFCQPLSWLSVYPQEIIDPGCSAGQAWVNQTNLLSDTVGNRNVNYPEASASYWGMKLEGPTGTTFSVRGTYPRARYVAIQVYDEVRNLIDAIGDSAIDPDPGQNNPFRVFGPTGTYQVNVVLGRTPLRPPPNTIYTGGLLRVYLLYRVYYSDLTSDIAGGVPLPQVRVNGGTVLQTCPVRPLLPEDSLVWGRLDNVDYAGPVPAQPLFVATNPPIWTMTVTNRRTPYYPSADNSYLSAFISREFLRAPHNFDMLVIRMRAPTYPDTQSGESPTLALGERQVRFWSMCQNEPVSTGVVRCVSDNRARTVDGMATFVISDPSRRPSEETLQRHGAVWIPWGALYPGDFVYDVNGNVVAPDKPAFFYGLILYRQTIPNPAWPKSMVNISNLPRSEWKTAMGDYWPTSGYCRAADFESVGFACTGR
jgi:hypothetical protein